MLQMVWRIHSLAITQERIILQIIIIQLSEASAASSATGVTGDNNTFIGYQASTTNGTAFSNSTAIGVYSSVDASDCLVLGNVNGVTPTNVGTRVLIGYTNPSTAVNTDFRLYVNSGANGHAGFLMAILTMRELIILPIEF